MTEPVDSEVAIDTIGVFIVLVDIDASITNELFSSVLSDVTLT